MASVNTLPLEQIAESPFNPRKSFDKDELADQIVEQLVELGLVDVVRQKLERQPAFAFKPPAPAPKKREAKPTPPPRSPAVAKVCSIPGCRKKILGRGYCSMHYYRDRRGLDMTAAPNPGGKGTKKSGRKPKSEPVADKGQPPGKTKVIAGHPRNYAGDMPERRERCAAYNTCLAAAAKQKWQNWTCAGCTGPVDKTVVQA